MNRNVWLLSLCQALLMTGNILLISVIGLVGKKLAPDQSMITLPVAMQFLGLMAATIPASLIMGRLGRRKGFSIGNLVGITGASVATYSLSNEMFGLFCVGTLLLGVGIGFGTLYRFAAIEVCEEHARHQAKAQAFNEFFVFSCVTVTALLSGWLESTVGWEAMNLYVLPFVIAIIVMFGVNTYRANKVVA